MTEPDVPAASGPRYLIVLQCHLVKQRCSGFFCENAFHERTGGFARYDADQPLRMLSITCGGCCGRATLRKLSNALKHLRRRAGIGPEDVVVHLASCVAWESFHGPPCPHLDYLKTLVERKQLAWQAGTQLSDHAESRRDAQGRWQGMG